MPRGGKRIGAGRKPRIVRFRHLDGSPFTPKQTARLDAAMRRFGCVRIRPRGD